MLWKFCLFFFWSSPAVVKAVDNKYNTIQYKYIIIIIIINKLAADFPEVISQEVVRSKWEDYLRLKHVARDLVKHKMEKKRVEILQEMKVNGGFNSRFFWG